MAKPETKNVEPKHETISSLGFTKWVWVPPISVIFSETSFVKSNSLKSSFLQPSRFSYTTVRKIKTTDDAERPCSGASPYSTTMTIEVSDPCRRSDGDPWKGVPRLLQLLKGGGHVCTDLTFHPFCCSCHSQQRPKHIQDPSNTILSSKISS